MGLESPRLGGNGPIVRHLNTARVIPTRYKEVLFRSRTEARAAVFLDSLDVRWVYEPEGYELPGNLWYLPDFYLPDRELFLEIKPYRPNEQPNLAGALGLARAGAIVLALIGALGQEEIRAFSPALFARDLAAPFAPVTIAAMHRPLVVAFLAEMLAREPEQIEVAYIAAREARFEHGEQP